MAGTNKEPFVGLAAGFSPAGVSCEATRGKAPITWLSIIFHRKFKIKKNKKTS